MAILTQSYITVPMNPQIESQGHFLTHNGICWSDLVVPLECYYFPVLSGLTCLQNANGIITYVLGLVVKVPPERVIFCHVEKSPEVSFCVRECCITLHRERSLIQSLSGVHTKSPQRSQWKYTITHLRVPIFTNYA